jgi:hypothetical protein
MKLLYTKNCQCAGDASLFPEPSLRFGRWPIAADAKSITVSHTVDLSFACPICKTPWLEDVVDMEASPKSLVRKPPKLGGSH